MASRQGCARQSRRAMPEAEGECCLNLRPQGVHRFGEALMHQAGMQGCCGTSKASASVRKFSGLSEPRKASRMSPIILRHFHKSEELAGLRRRRLFESGKQF